METTVKNATYHEQMDIQNTLQLREVLKTLPGFAKGYFRAIEPTTSTKTRISYAYDIRTFFRYLQESNPLFKNKEITELKVDILDQLDAIDIEEYQEYLKVLQQQNHHRHARQPYQQPDGPRPEAVFRARH